MYHNYQLYMSVKQGKFINLQYRNFTNHYIALTVDSSIKHMSGLSFDIFHLI